MKMKNKIQGKEKIKTKSTVHDLDNRVIQENSIENSVQDYLSYILKAHSPCSTTSAYPK